MIRMIVQSSSIVQAVLFFCLMGYAAATDIRKREIPPFIWILVAFLSLLDFRVVHLLGILAALPLLMVAVWGEPDRLGGGDIKFVAATGLVLGLQGTYYGIIIGLTLQVVIFGSYVLMTKKKRQEARNLSLPLAPCLAIGFSIIYFIKTGEIYMNLFKNRTILGVFCIVLSLLICFGITPLFNKGISQKTKIVRAIKKIKTGDKITKDKIQLVEVGSYNLPENVIRTKETVVGSYALADLSVGDYILNTKVSKTPATENSYLYRLDGRKQAISITIDKFADGLSGKLMSGDIISVIAPDYKKQGATVIPPELNYVEVISVTTSSGTDANTGEQETDADERALPSTVTLLATPEQGKILAELEADGVIHLALVYRGDEENAKKFLAMQTKILEELYPEEETSLNSTMDNAPKKVDKEDGMMDKEEKMVDKENKKVDKEGK
jgi:pilus assembly protein CpaB